MSLLRPLGPLSLSVAIACSAQTSTPSHRASLDNGATHQSGMDRALVCDSGAAILDLLNHPTTNSGVLQVIGVHPRAAINIAAYRDGDDGTPGTTDDRWFASLLDISSVPQVGDTAMAQIDAHTKKLCPTVIMSPQAYDDSHIQLAIEAIDRAESSVDIAMYSFRDDGVMGAIEDALDRGVYVRVVYHGASDDRKDPAGTRSAELEEMGIEVRWVNKIMHHKFALIDGPHAHPYEAWRSTLVSGSGNWSWSAATKYDENTVALTGDARLNLAMQQEFNLLWDNGRPVEWNEDIVEQPVIEILDTDIASAPGSTVALTSDNFHTYESSRYGPTFSALKGQKHVLDTLVGLIGSAERQILIASGHLRFKPVFDAIVAQKARYPDLDVRVYLDGQEYASTWYFDHEMSDYTDCLEAAENEEDAAECENEGAHFGTALHAAGIPLRYKYCAYRWDYRYAVQMHHKYVVIDQSTLATGSYNISPNAEYGTLENLVIYSSARYPELVEAFHDNFEIIWETGRPEGLYDNLIHEITEGTETTFPIVFDPMALSWDEIADLKDAIDAHCPEIDSWTFRNYPSSNRTCDRE